MFKNFFKTIEKSYTNAEDAHLMGDRKTAIFNNLAIGYVSDVLVYKKASIKEVNIGTSPIKGWHIVETVADPQNKNDGFVICVPTK